MPKPRKWLSPNEYRKLKRAQEKAYRIGKAQEEEVFREALEHELVEEKKHDTLTNRLWGTGRKTPNNPAGILGWFPWLVLMIVGVPILAIAYYLSLTWVGFVIMLVVFLGMAIRDRFRSQ